MHDHNLIFISILINLSFVVACQKSKNFKIRKLLSKAIHLYSFKQNS